MLMKILRTDSGYVVILINKNKKAQHVELLMQNAKPYSILTGNEILKEKLSTKISLQPEETKVIEYRE